MLVVDGDTFVARLDGVEETVRLLNVDTPETVDPARPVECLGPEAAAAFAALLPVGAQVELSYDVDRRDRYGRLLAGVRTDDDLLVNAELARRGLGVAELIEPNRRFYDEVRDAQGSAEGLEAGLFGSTTACTLSAQVAAVEQQTAALTAPVTTTSGEYDAVVTRAEGLGVRAEALLAQFAGPRIGPVWDVYARSEQDAFAVRVTATRDLARATAELFRTSVDAARVAEADQRRVTERARRAQVLEEQRVVREQAAARRLEPDRAAASALTPERSSGSSSSTGSGSSSGTSSSGGSSSDGYTGPRCYLPGGKVYRPC